MKKILIIFISLICVVGCSCSTDKASDAVEKYLNSYQSLDEGVLKNIDDLIANENLNDNSGDLYKETLKRQYRDLIYTIENESYDGDTAEVTVKITVYDYYAAEKEAQDYLNNNPNEFITDGIYDTTKFLEYKLEQMKNTNEMVSYNIVIKTNDVNGKWEVEQPDEETLEKIHGIYNYDLE